MHPHTHTHIAVCFNLHGFFINWILTDLVNKSQFSHGWQQRQWKITCTVWKFQLLYVIGVKSTHVHPRCLASCHYFSLSERKKRMIFSSRPVFFIYLNVSISCCRDCTGFCCIFSLQNSRSLWDLGWMSEQNIEKKNDVSLLAKLVCNCLAQIHTMTLY